MIDRLQPAGLPLSPALKKHLYSQRWLHSIAMETRGVKAKNSRRWKEYGKLSTAEWNLTLILRLHSNATSDKQHWATFLRTLNLSVCCERPFPPLLPSYLHTAPRNNINTAVILYNRPSNLNWQLQPHCGLKYRPTCRFSSPDSSWQLRGTTADWEYMKGSLSDDSTGKIESCDVMETRPLTDTVKEARLSAPAHNHSYPRSMCAGSNS